jgi:hypothetical protein
MIKPKKDFWEEIAKPLDDNVKYFFEKSVSAQLTAEKKYISSYYLFIIFSGALFIISSSLSNKISVLGMEISDINILKWLVPCALSFFHYQGLSAFYWENFHRKEIEKVIEKHFSDLDNSHLQTFFSSPSFFNLERLLANKDDDKIAKIFGIGIGIFLVFLPFAIIVYFTFMNIVEWNLVNSLILKVVVLVIVGIFFIRNIFLAKNLSR